MRMLDARAACVSLYSLFVMIEIKVWKVGEDFEKLCVMLNLPLDTCSSIWPSSSRGLGRKILIIVACENHWCTHLVQGI